MILISMPVVQQPAKGDSFFFGTTRLFSMGNAG
jgi:hypothetical protein